MWGRPENKDEKESVPLYAQPAEGTASSRLNASSSAKHQTPAESQVTQLASQLHDAIYNNQKSVFVDMLCRQTPDQVAPIIAAFKEKYGESPAHYIRMNVGGDDKFFYDVIIGCALSEVEFDAWSLHQAMDKGALNEDAFIDILVGATPDEIKAIKSAYEQMFNSDIGSDLHKHIGIVQHGLVKFLDYVLNTDHSTSNFNPETDAATLFAAQEGRLTIDDDRIFSVLTSRPPNHLVTVFEALHHRHHTSIEQIIHSGFKLERHLKRALVSLCGSIRDRVGEIADQFHSALSPTFFQDLRDGNFNGVREGKLARLAVRHRAPDVRAKVRDAYGKKHGKPLTAAVTQETKGDFRMAVLACLGEAKRVGDE